MSMFPVHPAARGKGYEAFVQAVLQNGYAFTNPDNMASGKARTGFVMHENTRNRQKRINVYVAYYYNRVRIFQHTESKFRFPSELLITKMMLLPRGVNDD